MPAVKRPAGKQPAMSFIGKSYAMISDPASDHLLSWDHDGETFSVRNPERLALEVFPAVFSHASYPSFTRALNAYGFRQVARNKWRHSDFRRGSTAGLDSIQRRRPPSKRAGAAGGGAGGSGQGQRPGEGPEGVAPAIQIELLGFNAAGCMQKYPKPMAPSALAE
ncbi:HSF-type DNA-binding-domain-containing protein [Pavlovales sp. CCMP2436]|nr:HSF-type DNA-binding-domain-containing protein [Pavlovales sp. CCMP2436]